MKQKYDVYIQAALRERFDQEENKSGLVNSLLASYYRQKGGTTEGTGYFTGKTDTDTLEVSSGEEDNDWAENLKYDSVMNLVYDMETKEPVSITPDKLKWLKDHGKVIR